NPSNGNTVTIVSRENLSVEIYDILGKKIKMQNITPSQNKLNISGLSKGVYLVRFNSSKGSTTKKLIKS
ncbi:MAG: T9SS type A sorting domain-containing protein, partial [Oceanihabitans sp.]|nr:T9SS type A sorting domain-containing protein [Oceanihabitans sp.]